MPSMSNTATATKLSTMTELYEELQDKEALIITIPAEFVAQLRRELSKTKELANRKLEPEFQEQRRLYTEVLSSAGKGKTRIGVYLVGTSSSLNPTSTARRNKRTSKLLEAMEVQAVEDAAITMGEADNEDIGHLGNDYMNELREAE